MEKYLEKIWLNQKEINVYMYLVEYGISWASEIWKKLNIPKSTINFIADNLWKKWFLKKTFTWNTWLYEADITMLQENIEKDILLKNKMIEELIPFLKEKNKNVKSKPKIKFFDWVDSCKKAYLDILKIKNEFFEFWAHRDLENTFWKNFMEDFINERIKRNLFCNAIWSSDEVEKSLQKLDKEQKRNIKIFDSNFWEINSSIALYDNKTLILNLKWVCNWVLIENADFTNTMKTIFNICTKK